MAEVTECDVQASVVRGPAARSCALSWVACSGESRGPHREDAQAALWRGLGDEESRLPANASTKLLSTQAALGGTPLAPVRPSDNCSLMRRCINHGLYFLYSDALTFGAMRTWRECPSQGQLIPRDGKHLPESTTFRHDPADLEPAPPTASFTGLSRTGPLSLP